MTNQAGMTEVEGQSAPEIRAETPAPEVTTQHAVISGFTLRELSGWLAFGVPLLYLTMAAIEGSSYIWRPLAILLYMLLLLVAIAFILFGNFPSEADEKYDLYEFNAALTLLGAIAILVSFSQISRHLYLLFGGFAAQQTSYWHWLRYGFANVLESVLFDVPAIYDWNISEITATAFWSRTVLLIFRTSLEFIVVAAILRQAKIARQKWHSPKKAQNKNYFAFILPSAGQLILVSLWGIPIAVSIGAVINDGLSLESSWSALRFGAPVVVGGWLAWQSLRAFGLPNAWNKLLALAGIVAGIWLVRESWPAFRTFLGQ